MAVSASKMLWVRFREGTNPRCGAEVQDMTALLIALLTAHITNLLAVFLREMGRVSLGARSICFASVGLTFFGGYTTAALHHSAGKDFPEKSHKRL